jgi:uncharacterized membrane protein
VSDGKPFPSMGLYVYGLATIAAGVINLVWGSFESGHQPIQALGDHVPGATAMAYIAAIWLVLGGAAILWPRSARAGAAASAVIYFIFALFWLPRLISAPHVLGYRIDVISGVLSGVGQQLVLAAAAMIVHAELSANAQGSRREAETARWIFGLSTIVFGVTHLTGTPGVAALVPIWIPLGGTFWAILTGIAIRACRRGDTYRHPGRSGCPVTRPDAPYLQYRGIGTDDYRVSSRPRCVGRKCVQLGGRRRGVDSRRLPVVAPHSQAAGVERRLKRSPA